MIQDLTNRTLDNRYRFDGVIGEGTFARVYRVHDLKRGVNLAAKVLRSDIAHEVTFLERFKREAGVLQKLQHPNIVRYYETVETDGVVFILLDYIAGDNLQTYLYRISQPLAVTQTLAFLKPVTAALSYAHGENIIHRDIKPANILLGDNGQVYITDFGIARLLNEASTLTLDSSIGTPLYMAPEQIQSNEVTRATDIYALGVLLFQMLTNSLPFIGGDPKAEGTSIADRVAYEHVHLPPPSPRERVPGLPQAVEDVVLRCLRKAPTARYHSVSSIYDALAEAIGATPGEIQAVSVEGKAVPPDVKLPEWSKVLQRPVVAETSPENDAPEKIDTRAATLVSSEIHAESDDSQSRPTDMRPPGPSESRKTQQHLQVPPPASYAPPNPVSSQPLSTSGYNPPAPRSYAPPLPRPYNTQGGSQSFLIGVLIVTIIFFITVICLTAVFLATDIFGDDDSGNPTPRLTTAAQVTPSALVTFNAPVATGSTNLFPDPTGSGATQIAANGTPISSSETGRDFVYAAENDNSLDIFRGSTSGSSPVQLTSNPLNETGPAYSPDGSQIAYYAYESDAAADIWLMNADGSEAHRITDTPANERVVSWSPDGKQLAYHSNADGNYDIYIYDLNSGNSRNLTNSDFNDLGPAWSPDGQRIAFHTNEVRNFNEIFVINVDGTGRTQVTDGDWAAAFAAWSGENRLVFHAILDREYQIDAINADGSGFQELLSGSSQRHPDPAGDGQFLIYNTGSTASPDIYYTDLSTGETRQLTSGFFPDWKP